MTEKECYYKLYGDLIRCVPHYQKIDISPGAVNFVWGLQAVNGAGWLPNNETETGGYDG